MKNMKLVRLVSGEEIVAEVKLGDLSDNTYTLIDPIILIPAGEGKIGFMPFMPYTKAKDGIEIDGNHIMFMVDPVDDLVDNHRQFTTGISVPEKRIVT